jgi:GNAT superfamily N-acetyltransferase
MTTGDAREPPRREVRRLGPAREQDFLAVHCDAAGLGWCRCVAWWVPTWEGWGERTAEENLALRRELWAKGEHDGYVAYEDGRPVATCQVGRRDRLAKLVRQYSLEPDPAVWAITCFAVDPARRGTGLARALLSHVLAELADQGVARVEAYPRRGRAEPGEVWTGPEALFLGAGFETLRNDPARPVLSKPLL